MVFFCVSLSVQYVCVGVMGEKMSVYITNI